MTRASTNGRAERRRTRKQNVDPYHVEWLAVDKIKPSPENDEIYGEIVQDEQQAALEQSIEKKGLAEPILLTADRFILSGHRRYHACKRIGLDPIPVRFSPIRREDNPNFHRDLAEYNPQRIKTVGSLLREALLRNNTGDTYAAIKEQREASMQVDADFMDVAGTKSITPISERRRPFLMAVKKVIDEMQSYHPLSIRQIHYKLLNSPPLKQAPKRSKFDIEHYRYKNDDSSYDSLVDLLTAARYSGEVSMTCIDDPTRPQKRFGGWRTVSQFVNHEVRDFLVGFHRDRQQDQLRHIEVFGEKNTLFRIIERACAEYYVPFSIGRGFCSLPVWRDMAKRFRASRRERMTLIIISDYDPEGLELADDAIRSLNLHGVPVDGHRVAVTAEQIEELGLAEDFNPAKETSSRYESFVQRTGDDRTWEVEALDPEYLVEHIKAAIEANMDMDVYRDICEQEECDCFELDEIRDEIASQLEF